MRIAVGSDDLKTIRSGHFGESTYYKIFQVEGGKVTQTEVRENVYLKNANGEHQHGEAKNIMQLLRNCDVFLGRSMGMHSIPKLVAKGVQPVITKETDIEQTISKYLNGDISSFRCFDSEIQKFTPCKERPE